MSVARTAVLENEEMKVERKHVHKDWDHDEPHDSEGDVSCKRRL